MKRDIHYDQRYDTLSVVRKFGSYTAAGEMLALTPSAVAQQIHSIEQELDTVLFTRTQSGLVPTRECDLISDYVTQIHMICQRMNSDLSTGKQTMQRLVLGLTPSVTDSCLSDVLTCCEKKCGDLQITVINDSSSLLYKALRSGAIDLAVVDGEFPHDEFNAIQLDTDFLAVAVSVKSKYADKGIITLDELRREKLILRSKDSGTRSLFEANVRSNGLTMSDFNVMMEIDNVATIKKLVAADYGISVLSNKACEADVAKGLLSTVKLSNMNMVRNIHILYRKDFTYNSLLLNIRTFYAEAMHRIDNSSNI